MTITLKNNFHNREVNVRVAELPANLTPSQTRRVRQVLCGHSECTCGKVRGPQYHDGERIEVTEDIVGGQVVYMIARA